jgi:hypothetical protein
MGIRAAPRHFPAGRANARCKRALRLRSAPRRGALQGPDQIGGQRRLVDRPAARLTVQVGDHAAVDEPPPVTITRALTARRRRAARSRPDRSAACAGGS